MSGVSGWPVVELAGVSSGGRLADGESCVSLWLVVAVVGGCGRWRSPHRWRVVGSFLAGGELWGACCGVLVWLGWFAGRGCELLLPEDSMRFLQYFAGAKHRRK